MLQKFEAFVSNSKKLKRMKTKKYMFFLLFVFYNQIINSQCFSSLQSSLGNTVGKKTDGTIWGWGYGQAGNLNNNEQDSFVPTPLDTSADWTSLSSVDGNTFAIKNDGTLWAVGGNFYGCLGIGTTAQTPQFTQVGTANNWKQISATNVFTAGVRTDGSLWAWGENTYFQVGDGTTTQRNSPVQIGGTSDWKAVATTRSAVGFALKNNGTLWAWGNNIAMLLGDSSVTGYTTPHQHNPDTDWDRITMGGDHMMAIKTDNTLWCWGNPTQGQTGHDPANPSFPDVPFQIPGTWQTVAGGYRFSMGIKSDGTLWAWGLNDVGQLGLGTTTNTHIPTQVGTASNWVAVSCGFTHTAALQANGALWLWGTNDYGQLGNGTTTPQPLPTYLQIDGCTLANDSFNVTENKLKISPNPAHTELTIDYKGRTTINTIEIIDLTGKVVYKNQPVASSTLQGTFNIGFLQSGNYIVQVKNNNVMVSQQKLIIE